MKGVLNELYHVTNFEFVKARNVLYVSDSGMYSASIVLKQDTEWSVADFTANTAFITEERIIDSPAGAYFKCRFRGSVPAKSDSFPFGIREFTDEPVYCRLKLSNGKYFLAGPVSLKYQFDSETHEINVSFENDSITGLLEIFVAENNDNDVSGSGTGI